MKKVVKFASLLLVGGSLIFTSCSKKKDDEVTPVGPVNPTCDGGTVKTKQVIIDNSTSTSTYEKAYNQNVTKCDGSAIIFLDVKASKDMDKIYMTLSQDNGPSSPVYSGNQDGFAGSNSNTSVEADGATKKTFMAGSSSSGYTLDIPDLGGGITATSYIKVPVVVPVRNSDAATTDVYTIWITNGNGDFTSTGKRTIIGPITVTLNYKGTTSLTYISGAATVGDQNATPPSYVTTKGQISTVSGASLISDLTTDEERATALNSLDINFVGLASDGSTIGNGQTPYFISPGLRTSVGFTGNNQGTIVTKYSKYTGTTSFESMSATDISNLTNPTSDRIVVENNTTYVFLTSDNRKGVIKTSSLSTVSTGKTVSVNIKALTK